MLSQSISGLYDMCEESWYNAEHTSVKVLADVMERWIKKYKSTGESLVYNYLCKAMCLSYESSDGWIEYFEKAKQITK